MTEELKIAVHHLLWIWHQYGGADYDPDSGLPVFEHRNMRAGERATDWLVTRGLGIDQGYQFEPNQ